MKLGGVLKAARMLHNVKKKKTLAEHQEEFNEWHQVERPALEKETGAQMLKRLNMTNNTNVYKQLLSSSFVRSQKI